MPKLIWTKIEIDPLTKFVSKSYTKLNKSIVVKRLLIVSRRLTCIPLKLLLDSRAVRRQLMTGGGNGLLGELAGGHMEFKELEYICTVAEYGSITKAAQALFISQPSLSFFISRTEERLGLKLFEREVSPLRLTYAGELYVQKAREILRTSDMVRREFRDISHNLKGKMRIGFPTDRASYMLPFILPAFNKAYPGIRIEIKETSSQHLLEEVERGNVDFVVVPLQEDKDLETDLASAVVYEEELYLTLQKAMLPPNAISSDKPDTVELSKLNGLPLILLKKGRGIRTKVDKMFRTSKVKPNVLMEVDSNATAYRLSAAGVGAAIVPSLTLGLSKSGVPVEKYHLVCPETATWKVRVVYKKDTYIGLVEKDFFLIAREVMQKIADEQLKESQRKG